ncbi:MAG: hypothetical protein LAT84_02750 [Balneolia bacterium]|nr:hypothetical protein [Balneolia bacterium]
MMKKIATFLVLFMAIGYTQANAQYIFGASYEVRSDEPTNGFGLHFQNDFTVVPMLLDVGFRFQTSFYNEKYNTLRDLGSDDLQNVRQDDTAYDFGLGVIATASAGFVAPYVGLGIGYEVFNRDTSFNANGGSAIVTESSSDNGLYYYGAVGVGVSAIPILRPFVEYRYRGVTSTDFMPSEYGTWAFGVQLRF